ncbi:MAG: phosphatase [Symploca sp. SIO2C1]|nr:phosphatase [Symploca sp. SIO2C1]
MELAKPLETVFNFLKLSISRYTKVYLVRGQLEDIFNFLKLTNSVATAGQPTKKQLLLIKNAGYKVVVNLSPKTALNALPDEKEAVESLGMKYIHLPVDFNNPTMKDFDKFYRNMQENSQKPVFVHCAGNLRVSSFMYLYRRIHDGFSDEQAQIELQKIWTPNKTWEQFINQVIEREL